MKKILTFFLLLIASNATAQMVPPAPSFPADITLTWTWPTLYTDDSPIQPGDLRGGIINCDDAQGFRVIDVEIPIVTALGSPQTQVFAGAIPRPGVYTCVSYAVTILDVRSVASNTAIKTYAGSGMPHPPTNLTVQ